MSVMAAELIVQDAIPVVTPRWSDDLVFSSGVVRDRPVRAGATVVGRRLYVLPGLVDAHSHLVTSPRLGEAGYTEAWRLRPAQLRRRIADHLRSHAASGVFGVRDAGAPSGFVAEMAQGRRPATRPVLKAAGRFIAPPRRYPSGVADEVSGAAAMADAAAREGRRGGGWVKLIGDYLDRDEPLLDPAGDWTEEEIRSAADAAHAVGARIAIHAMTAEMARRALAAGVDTVEHGCGLSEPDLQYMSSHGIAWTPTLAAFNHLLMRIRKGERLLPARFMEAAVANMQALVPKAADAGVILLCGTDGIIPHGAVAREVFALLEAGLEIESALRAATVNGWSLLGLPQPLSDGAPADALLFDHDPRTNPRLLLRPTFAIRNGQLVPVRR